MCNETKSNNTNARLVQFANYRRQVVMVDKRINEQLAKVCEMLATVNGAENQYKEKFLEYADVFRKLGNIQKKTKPKEDKTMGKKLTDKQKEGREVKLIISKIKKLEKVHPQELVERATSRYKNANLDKRRAEKEMKELEKKLQDAKRRLK